MHLDILISNNSAVDIRFTTLSTMESAGGPIYYDDYYIYGGTVDHYISWDDEIWGCWLTVNVNVTGGMDYVLKFSSTSNPELSETHNCAFDRNFRLTEKVVNNSLYTFLLENA